MTPAAKILIVDDDPSAVRTLHKALRGLGNIYYATSGKGALDVLAQYPIDVVLLDANMPEMDGFETCRVIGQVCPHTPVIFVTADRDVNAEMRALDLGARDFIGKPFNPPVVGARVRLHLELKRHSQALRQSLAELQDAYVELERLAGTDKLTGAWSRKRLEEALVNERERLRRYGHPLCAMILDIDHFKRINDAYGHLTGDQVLVGMAAVVKASLRATDSLTRWGGEEFIILSPDTALPSANMMAERVREAIAVAAFPPVGQVTVSIGVAECLPGEGWELWLKRADDALYRAKTNGRNQVQAAPERPDLVALGDNVAAGFVQLHWRRTYECGHPVIDRQHRGLFDDANRLLTAVLGARPVDEIAALVDGLTGDVARHFAAEEAIFTAAGWSGAAEHMAIHRDLLAKTGTVVRHFQSGTLGLGELFQFLAHDIVARHMLRADREFFPFLGSG